MLVVCLSIRATAQESLLVFTAAYSEYEVFRKYTCIEIIVLSYSIALCCPA
jgi:hypothetical protein